MWRWTIRRLPDFGQSDVSGKRGRGAAKKSKVILPVKVSERSTPVFVNMAVVPKVEKQRIGQIALENLQPASTVKTDGWSAYKELREQGVIHERAVVGTPENASKVLPWVHIVLSNCKAVFRGTHHGASTRHIHGYLAEFC